MIIKFFHNGQTMLIDRVDFCKYRQLDWGEQIAMKDGAKDFTDDMSRPVACSSPGNVPPVRNVAITEAGGRVDSGVSNARLEFWYEQSGKSEQLLCHHPVFLMSDEGKTIERI